MGHVIDTVRVGLLATTFLRYTLRVNAQIARRDLINESGV